MNQQLSKKMRGVVRKQLKRDLAEHFSKLPILRKRPRLVPKFIWKILYNIMFTTGKAKKLDKEA